MLRNYIVLVRFEENNIFFSTTIYQNLDVTNMFVAMVKTDDSYTVSFFYVSSKGFNTNRILHS